MINDEILYLSEQRISTLLAGRELEIIRTVSDAYITHATGESHLPHSTFVRFPNDEHSRIVALPAYLGKQFGVAGIKWVSSFPRNLEKGIDRASAIIILNSIETGLPIAVIRGANISAKRTAASATLAAQLLHNEDPVSVGLIGCGLINFEIIKFLKTSPPSIRSLMIYDLDEERSIQFRQRLHPAHGDIEVYCARELNEVLNCCSVVSLATTATMPYIFDLSMCPKSCTILNISLRDLAPEVILPCDNVVDDVEHIFRGQTSVHLAEQLTGNRDFVRCTLGDIIRSSAMPKRNNEAPSIFSPFGLGVLDLALAKLACDIRANVGSCFISYSHKDEEFAKKLYICLREANIRVWFAPEDIGGGRKLHEQIYRAIEKHDKLLLVLSKNSLKSEWVMSEIRRAIKAGKRERHHKLFPIRLVDIEAIQNWECFDADSGKDLAIEVREYFIPDFSNWRDPASFEMAFNGLMRDLLEPDLKDEDEEIGDIL